jgi:hypothetical protein
MNRARLKPFVFLLLYPLIFCGCAGKNTKKVCINSCCVQAELAQTDAKRQRGLMFRDSLAENQGMIFIFDKEDRYGFWMKNMRFPLDIIWIDAEKRIVDIKKDVPACREESCETLMPAAEAKYVLEVQSGFTDRRGIKIGDRIEF